MKVIITGAAGFIGSHLVDQCLEQGWEVIGIDNLANGSMQNLSHLADVHRFTFVLGDINQASQIEHHFIETDYVFHLAGLADIVPSIREPFKYHQANVSGTLSMLELCRKYKIKKILYAASSSCYGQNSVAPTSEEAECRPCYPYAMTKYVAEQYVQHWGEVYQLPYISLRLFNVYGTRARSNGTYGAVFKTFLAQKLAGKAYTIVGDGTQLRDFIYVTDVANAFVMAAKSQLKNEIFNIGSGTPKSINHLTDLLKGEKTYIPKRPGEPDCTHADITKVQESLNWLPLVSFEQGVAKMIEEIQYWKDSRVWSEEDIAQETKLWFESLSRS